MHYLLEVYKMNTLGNHAENLNFYALFAWSVQSEHIGKSCPPCFIPKSTQWSSVEFIIGNVHYKLLGKFHFGPYWSSI